MFENLRNELTQDVARQKAEYMQKVTTESFYFKDNLTPSVVFKFAKGLITEEEARRKALEKACRKIDKWYKEQLEKLENVAAARDIDYITISVDFVRSRTWGYNPHCEIYGSDRYFGTASGCGYDKESAAVAQALNQDFSVLKLLYTYKENRLAEGQTDTSKSACTGHDNRNIIGYGAGYNVLPAFEGGVGVSCFESILNKCGFTCRTYYGKHENGYNFHRKEIA